MEQTQGEAILHRPLPNLCWYGDGDDNDDEDDDGQVARHQRSAPLKI